MLGSGIGVRVRVRVGVGVRVRVRHGEDLARLGGGGNLAPHRPRHVDHVLHLGGDSQVTLVAG